jgi:hypothetical protein
VLFRVAAAAERPNAAAYVAWVLLCGVPACLDMRESKTPQNAPGKRLAYILKGSHYLF